MTMNMVRTSKGDSSVEMTQTFLEDARNRAVAERRNFVLTVVSDTQLQVERVEVPDGTLTVVDILQLEGDQEFVEDWTLPRHPRRTSAAPTRSISPAPRRSCSPATAR